MSISYNVMKELVFSVWRGENVKFNIKRMKEWKKILFKTSHNNLYLVKHF